MSAPTWIGLLYGDGDRSLEVEALRDATWQLDPTGRGLDGVDALAAIVSRAEGDGRYVTPVSAGVEVGPLILGYMETEDRDAAVRAIDAAIAADPGDLEGIEMDPAGWRDEWLGLRRGLTIPQTRETGVVMLSLWPRPKYEPGHPVALAPEVAQRYRALVEHLAGGDALTLHAALGPDRPTVRAGRDHHHARRRGIGL